MKKSHEPELRFMKDKDSRRLRSMLQTIDKLLKYCEKETLDTFLSNVMLLDACAMNILVLGEQANHLSDNCQKRHPQVDWRANYGLRNRVAHNYFGVYFEILWDLIQDDLKPLKLQLTEILTRENAENTIRSVANT